MHTAEGMSNPKTYGLIYLISNGQGDHYLSANNNAYYVAIDSDNNIQVLPESELTDVHKLIVQLYMHSYIPAGCY